MAESKNPTGPAPWTPPSQPEPSPVPAAPLPVTSSPMLMQPAQPPRKTRAWIPITIAVGSILLIAIVVGGVMAIANFASSRLGSLVQGQPLETGAEQWPTPIKQLACDGPCFDRDDSGGTVLSESDLDDFGITKHDFPWGTYDPTTADEMYRSMTATWRANSGSPDTCVFALGNSPTAIDLVSDDGLDDEVQFTGEHASADVTTTIDQSVRVFPDTEAASAYMSKLKDQIDACSTISIGVGEDYYEAQITPAPMLDLREDTAAIGWVRTGDPGPRWRAYVYDMQRGNLVVRTRMLTDGTYYESEFRDFLAYYGFQLGEITPNP